MKTNNECKYTKTHEWVKEIGNGLVEIGLSDYAQQALGDLVFIGLCEVGENVVAGESMGDAESVKAVSDLYSPVSGEVVGVNEAILDAPQLINEDAQTTWLIKVQASDYVELMSEEEYVAYVDTL